MGISPIVFAGLLQITINQADTYVALSSSYAQGLSSAADGQVFSAPLDAWRAGVWRKSGATAVLIGAQPIDATLGAVRPAISATSMPWEPQVDVCSIDGLWSYCEVKNRASAAAPKINLLFASNGTTRWSGNGGATITVGQQDSGGGSSAARFYMPASGVPFLLRWLRQVSIPAGQWTFSLRHKASNGVYTPFKISFDGGTTWAQATPSDTLQTLSQTFIQTSQQTRSVLIAAQYPAASTAAVDIIVESIALVPGAVADTSLPALVQIGFAGASPEFSGAALTLKSASVVEAVGSFAANSWTLQFAATLNQATTQLLAPCGSGSGGGIGVYNISGVGQSLSLKSFNSLSPGVKIAGMGNVVVTIRYDGSAVTTFINGTPIKSVSVAGAGFAPAARWASFFGAISESGTISDASIGLCTGFSFWQRSLSDAEVASAAAVSAARALIHLSAIRSSVPVFVVEGNSISAGYTDSANASGMYGRAVDLQTIRPAYENRAVVSATLATGTNSLTYRLPGMLVRIAALRDRGHPVIVSVMIGTNDSSRLTTQAQVDAYVVTLLNYISQIKTAGASVMVTTPTPAGGLDAGYDSGALVVPSGPLAGTYDGGRHYLIAHLRQNASTAGYSLVDVDAVASWTTLSAAQIAGYFTAPDFVHPNSVGHPSLAGIVAPTLQAML